LLEQTIERLQEALEVRQITSVELVEAYIARIEAFDHGGPGLNSVREVNPDALAIARRRDRARFRPGTRKGPLYGIPILLKDNIATGDRQATTAGSPALASAVAVRDAHVAMRLRRAGAILLGKANLTEFANWTTVGMPSGYSALVGQVLNPYAPAVDADGIPIVLPGGSSSGSAVAAAANLAAVTVGTETAGSLLNPACNNGLVTVKPTVGLVSRAGILPIAASQDTAGPLARTVRDAAILLGALAGADRRDPATRAARGHIAADYTAFLDPDGLKGARIGLPSDPADPANDVYWPQLAADQRRIMTEVVARLRHLGAEIIEANIPSAGRIGGPDAMIDVPVTNPFSPLKGKNSAMPAVLIYEFKHGLAAYLAEYVPDGPIRSLADVIAVNDAAPRPPRFGQDLLLAAEATRGDLSEPAYHRARALDLSLSRQEGLDAYFDRWRLDAVLFPAALGNGIAARAGYPSVGVPAAYRTEVEGKPTPPYPYGISFTGRAWSEPTLLKIAYAWEQANPVRRPPACAPELG
jgi:amidase